MSRFTPGPWKVDKDYKGRMVVNCNDDNICIMDSLHEIDIKHNARLIAAAPELYEALKDVQRYLGGIFPSHERVDEIQALIAKIDGGE